jgi:hypothetical protein
MLFALMGLGPVELLVLAVVFFGLAALVGVVVWLSQRTKDDDN